MKVSYFPGCTLKTKAKQLDDYARSCAEVLGIKMEEIPDWQCCGGVFNTSSDEIATKLSAVRALSYAEKQGQPLISVCSACHNMLKQTNHAMQTDAVFASRVNHYITQPGQAATQAYMGNTQVYHYLELLRDIIGFDRTRDAVKKPLTGKKIGAYYGCLMLRPSSTMKMDDAENPRIMEDFIRAIGAEPVIYAMRNECCGGYVTMEDPALSQKKSTAILRNAEANGADFLITACPLCKYNLDKNGNIPVVYFTELLARALGIVEV